MAITNQQRKDRRKYLGSSDISAVLGLNPWRSAADVWLEKTGSLEDDANSAMADAGTRFEAATIEWCAERLGYPIGRGKMIVHQGGTLCANVDGLVEEKREIVEAKMTGIAEDWGDEGTGDVPPYVACQCHHQMFVLGPQWRRVWVPVAFVGIRKIEFRLYQVDWDNDVTNGIGEAGDKFMRDYVLTGVRPDGFKPSTAALNRVRRVPNKTVELEDSLLDEYLILQTAAKLAAEKSAAAADRLKAALGDGEAGRTPKGQIVTFFAHQRKEYIVKASQFRVLRIKK